MYFSVQNLTVALFRLVRSPTACFTGVVATDQFTIEDETLEQGGKNQYNLVRFEFRIQSSRVTAYHASEFATREEIML
jgi:hypothetical protein